MIIDYDHNPNITNEQRLQSLKESVQMALNDVESKEAASSAAAAASTQASAASAAASAASTAAGNAQTSADAANNALKSVVQGATTVEKAVSVMQTALEAVVDYDPQNDTVDEYFWHDANGAHVLGTSGDYRNDIDSTGMKIMDTDTETSVAEFGANGAVIGKATEAHTTIDEDGMQIYSVDSNNNLVELANIGYGEGASESSTAVAPYYTLGIRKPNSTIGNYSVAEGNLVTASGYNSHAEGFEAEASGAYSHAQNEGTIAAKSSQTVIGSYNVVDTASEYWEQQILIIGNGFDDDLRSNALAIDRRGQIECCDHEGTLKSIFDIFYPVGSYYETSNVNFDPNDSWGGRWVEDSFGRVTVAQDSSDTSFDTIGETGGNKGIQEHTHSDSFKLPNHKHNLANDRVVPGRASSGWVLSKVTAGSTSTNRYINIGDATSSVYQVSGTDNPNSNPSISGSVGGVNGLPTGQRTGNSGNLQPYVVVKRWHRIA